LFPTDETQESDSTPAAGLEQAAGASGRLAPPAESGVQADPVVAGLLADRPEAVAAITQWARPVAEHRAWGFESADDIVQETLLAVVRNIREGRFSGGDLCAYVRRIAKNLSISNYRKARARGVQVALSEESLDLRTPEVVTDVDHRVMVERILSSLDETCRQLIALAYFYGFSRIEIARRLGISEGATKVRLFRCIERVRGMYGTEQGASC